MRASCSLPCCWRTLARFEWAAANSGNTCSTHTEPSGICFQYTGHTSLHNYCRHNGKRILIESLPQELSCRVGQPLQCCLAHVWCWPGYWVSQHVWGKDEVLCCSTPQPQTPNTTDSLVLYTHTNLIFHNDTILKYSNFYWRKSEFTSPLILVFSTETAILTSYACTPLCTRVCVWYSVCV